MGTLSLSKTNRLYWLGRYHERVFTTLQFMLDCYDRMIDGAPVDYVGYCSRLGIPCAYTDAEDFVRRYLFDPDDPNSVRAAGLTARYVSGLPEGEGASHAWAEVWHDGLWYGFDTTRNCAVDESYLKLCVGRDFSDCPIERGVFLGGGDQTQTVFMKVTEQ